MAESPNPGLDNPRRRAYDAGMGKKKPIDRDALKQQVFAYAYGFSPGGYNPASVPRNPYWSVDTSSGAADGDTKRPNPQLPSSTTVYGKLGSEWVYDPVSDIWCWQANGERITIEGWRMRDVVGASRYNDLFNGGEEWAPEPCDHRAADDCEMCEMDHLLDEIIGEEDSVETDWSGMDWEKYNKLTLAEKASYQQWQSSKINRYFTDSYTAQMAKEGLSYDDEVDEVE